VEPQAPLFTSHGHSIVGVSNVPMDTFLRIHVVALFVFSGTLRSDPSVRASCVALSPECLVYLNAIYLYMIIYHVCTSFHLFHCRLASAAGKLVALTLKPVGR
jgi:succinate dehydrogenase/fumarate reductase cytochrome b subunit